MIHKSKLVASLTALALGLGGLALAVPISASADQPDFICEPLDSGKIDTVGDPATVTVYAPDGFLIDGYCVKAGTTKYFVPVAPPAAEVVVDHPDIDSVSHYSLSYVEIEEEPDLATATLEFTAASCDAAEAPKLPGSSISNATWGSDTDADALAYSIVATANPGAEFADGDGVSDDNLTKTFTGTLDPIVDDSSCDEEEPDLATATLEFNGASCSAAQSPKLPSSSISNAMWGSDTDADPLAYNIVATANPGAEFADGPGVSDDNLTKTFTGTLDPIVDDSSCDEEEPVKYSFCHATEVVGAKNGWNALGPLPVVAIVNGHGNHSGDIIPVINPDYPTGQNLTTLYPNYGPNVTGADILAGGCQDSPDLATADLAFSQASCFSQELPNIPGSSISNAIWGSDTDVDPLEYNIVATANANAEFAAGPGVSGDKLTKTFSGTLDPAFPDDDPRCVLGLVMPTVVFTQATCAADGFYTLGVADGYDPTHVTFTVNGTPGVLAGKYTVATAQVVTITAQAVAPNGLELDWVNPPPFVFLDAATCGELTTLALTGSAVSYLGWTLGGGALFLGFALLLVRRRREAASE